MPPSIVNGGQVHSVLVRHWIRATHESLERSTHMQIHTHIRTHIYGLHAYIWQDYVNVVTYSIKFNLFVYTCCVCSRAFPFIYIAITFVALDRYNSVRKRFFTLGFLRDIFHVLVRFSTYWFFFILVEKAISSWKDIQFFTIKIAR